MNPQPIINAFDDPQFCKKLEDIKKETSSFKDVAEKYTEKYKSEIEEGTRQKQLLLEDGKKNGLKEDEVMKEFGVFIPEKNTPILNFLYFMFRDEGDPEFETKRKEHNEKYGHLIDDFEYSGSGNLEDIKDMDMEILGKCSSYDMFKKIKKLKTLSHSPNENEAFIAYRMCQELCQRYQLDIDRIPIN